MPMFAFAGDWHGNTKWAVSRLQAFAARGVDTVHHLGDFGLWPGADGVQYLLALQNCCYQNRMTMRITLGNHEDYDQVPDMHETPDGWLFLPGYDRLLFAPRGHVWSDHGVTFASLGGAGSIDRLLRSPGISWWPQEAVSEGDVAALQRNLSALGRDRVDVMLTHEAPAGVVRNGGPLPPWAPPEVVHYCWQSRLLLTEAMGLARPRTLLHGHWHQWYDDVFEGADFDTRIIGLPDDGSAKNCVTATIDPETGISDIRVLVPG